MKTHPEYQLPDTYDQQAQQKHLTRAIQKNVLSNFFAAPSHKNNSAAVRTSPFIIYDPNCTLSLPNQGHVSLGHSIERERDLLAPQPGEN